MTLDRGHGETQFYTRADRTQYPLWELAVYASRDISSMADQDVQFWPDDALIAAAAILTLVDVGLKQWRARKFEECLVTAHVGQQAMARLERILTND